ncbi:hypothetical protein [Bartonella florencae]|uniref:hypothetical protein n=1 Tax=Bartonella florencae TaxID=928210 RepID=UPI0002ED38CE|nr:hypothetical protein [Bartonella florencae]
MQNSFAEGNASEIMLYDRAPQQAYNNAYVNTLTANHQAKSWVYLDAIIYKDTIVNDFGRIYLYAGAEQCRTEVEKVILS